MDEVKIVSEVGYKYICWDIGEDNADLYMSAVENREPIYHTDLTECKGRFDKEDLPGIYFCNTLDDLHLWVKELFEYANPSAIELIGITAIGVIQKRVYEDGRIAYIAESCRCRIIRDYEIPANFLKTIQDFFG
jgi:hypothetical protein